MHETPARPLGRPGKLRSQEELTILREYLDGHPDALIKDVTDYLALQRGIDIDASTVYRTMSKLGWLVKRSKVRERDTLGMWKPTLPRDENGNAWYGPAKDIGRVKRKRDSTYSARMKREANERLFDRVQDFVRTHMSQPRFDSSHDFAHVQRVVNLAKHILKIERAANPMVRYDAMVAQVAALMHDAYDYKYIDSAELLENEQPISVHRGEVGDESSILAQESPSNAPHGHITSPADSVPPHSGDEEENSESDESPSPNSSHQNPVSPHTNTSQEPNPPHSTNSDQTQSPHPNQNPTSPPSVPNRQTKNPLYQALENRLTRLRVPKRIIPAISSICTAISYTIETQHPELVTSILSSHPELAIVQDADRLEAMGAIGLGRAFTYGATKDPGRGMQGTMAHMEEKLLKLEGMMKTLEGRRLARVRTERMLAFRRWWEEERGLGVDLDVNADFVPPGSVVSRAPIKGPGEAAIMSANTYGSYTTNNNNTLSSSLQTSGPNRPNGLHTPHTRPVTSTEDDPDRQLMREAGMLT